MTYQYVLYEIEDHIATITLNRPKEMNAILPEVEDELFQALDQADADSEVRVMILTGAGKAFSAGYDLAGRDGSDTGVLDPSGKPLEDYIGHWWANDSRNAERLMHFWRLSKPVLCAVNGYAMGGGFWYQLACDITIASDRAVFAQPEVRHVSNTTFLFAALVGWKHANRYALTGDHFDAQEALRIGMLNDVVEHEELMPEVRRLAKRIALVPPAAVRMNKAIAMLGLQVSGVSNGMVLNGALSAIAHSSHGPDRENIFEAQRERGMRGYLEERDGPFYPEPFGPRSQ